MSRLDGKVALITGGARGMGASHARHLAALGARVVLGDVRDDAGRAVAAGIGPACRYVHHDVTAEAGWAAAVEATMAAFGRLDVLVNNAGILRYGPIAQMSLAGFREVLDVNLVGPWLGTRAVAEPMKATGGGSIVNISSVEGFAGAAGLAAYSASKFGLRGLTRVAARELGPYGIRVNSVHPGGIATPMTAEAAQLFPDSDPDAVARTLPLGRWGEAVEISRLVAFLASDESSYCTGSEFLADGGMLSGPGY
jgi:3alpha(or 20beta)-hydroxysteroid dehydrogenase